MFGQLKGPITRLAQGCLPTTPHTCPCRRTLMYSPKKGVNRGLIAFLQQRIDLRPVAIKNWWKNAKWDLEVKEHSHNPARRQVLGAQLAAAHFIVGKGGAVQFEGSDRWIERDKDGHYDIPKTFKPGFIVRAIDASNTNLMYPSFDNLENIDTLQYLNLSGCPHINDWCLDRLVDFRDSLVSLDLSNCPKVTERGLATLHRMTKLRRLRIADMPAVQYAPYVALLLEELLPDCVVEGVDYTRMQDFRPPETTSSFAQYEKKLDEAMKHDSTGYTMPVYNIKF